MLPLRRFVQQPSAVRPVPYWKARASLYCGAITSVPS